jgi:hypothetical protein
MGTWLIVLGTWFMGIGVGDFVAGNTGQAWPEVAAAALLLVAAHVRFRKEAARRRRRADLHRLLDEAVNREMAAIKARQPARGDERKGAVTIKDFEEGELQ